MRATTSFAALSYWSRSLSGHMWPDWKSWPHLNLVNDQGSDDKTGVYPVSFFPPTQLNCTAWWGPAHGSWRDTLRMIKSCGHFAFILLAS